MKKDQIRLEIKHLVLDGFPAGSEIGLDQIVSSEVQRLISQHGTVGSSVKSGDKNHFTVRDQTLGPDSSTQVLGSGIARSIVDVLTGGQDRG